MNRVRVWDGFVKVDVVETPNGKREVVEVTDSVAILVYNKTGDEVLLETQDRPAMARAGNPFGKTTEVAAGRFDKQVGLRELVKLELAEELGIANVADRDIEILNFGKSLALSAGVLTERQYLAYVEVTQEQIDSTDRLYGSPEEGELIERRFVAVEQLPNMMFEDMKTWALVQWFLAKRGVNQCG